MSMSNCGKNGNLVRSLELFLNTFIALGNPTIYLNGVERSLSPLRFCKRSKRVVRKTEVGMEFRMQILSNFLLSIWQTKVSECCMNFYVRSAYNDYKMIGPDAPLPQLANLYLDIRLKNRSFT